VTDPTSTCSVCGLPVYECGACATDTEPPPDAPDTMPALPDIEDDEQ